MSLPLKDVHIRLAPERHGALTRGRDPDGRIWYALPGGEE